MTGRTLSASESRRPGLGIVERDLASGAQRHGHLGAGVLVVADVPDALEGLAGGQAYAALSAGQVASYIFLEMANSLPETAQDLEAAVIGDRLAVRGLVSLADIGGSKILGPLAQVLSDRDTLLLSGTMNVLATGEGQFVVKELRFGQMRAPSGVIPRIVRQIDKTEDRGPMAPSAISLPLPPGVADVRVGGGMVTLYKRTQ